MSSAKNKWDTLSKRNKLKIHRMILKDNNNSKINKKFKKKNK